MIYLLMPDRFANGDASNDSTPHTRERADRSAFFGRHGGDLQGMIDHLDYIAGLGATAVWPTPLLLDDEPEGSYHGYACGDYYRIDPRFGSNELYREFVGKAHEHGLKVIMDIVTNHCGTGHWWMKDLPFRDWIHQFPEYTGTNVCFSTNMDPNASRYDLDLQESGWFVPSMPDMNLDNPYVLQYFKQWAVWWIEYAGLDGFRVDTYPYNEKVPMSEWCAAIRREYPDFNIVGECWTSSIPQLAYWRGGNPNKDGFDSHLPSIMDFPLQEAICRALPTDSLRWGEGMTRVYDCLSHDFVYHDLSKMMIFVANHDTDRIGDIVRRNPDRLETLDGDAGHDARHPADILGRRDDVHLERPLAGTRRAARGFPRRLGGRRGEPVRPRAARCRTGGALRLHAAALPMAQVEARDPQRPHDALPLARQHLRLFPL